MFASEIFETTIFENDGFRAVRAGQNGWNIVSTQSGQVVGTERNAQKARDIAKQLDNARLKVQGNKLQYTTSDGKKITGTPKEVMKEAAKTDPKIKTKFQRALQRSKLLTKRVLGGGWKGLLMTGQAIAQWGVYTDNVLTLQEFWSEMYPAGHPLAQGSPYAEDAFDRVLLPMRIAAATAIGTVLVAELKRAKKARQLYKFIRAFRLMSNGLLLIPGVGWLLRILIFVLTEGAIFVAGWAIQEYGPQLFEKVITWELETLEDAIFGTNKASDRPEDIDSAPTKQEILQRMARDPNMRDRNSNSAGDSSTSSSSGNNTDVDDGPNLDSSGKVDLDKIDL